MSILGSNMLAGAAGRARYEIERSLRFNSGDSAYLSRTPGSAGSSRKFTISVWVKIASPANSYQQITLLSAGSGSQSNSGNTNIQLRGNGTGLQVAMLVNGGIGGTYAQFTPLKRDVSSWYHVVVAVDSTQSTQANRCRAYINGVEETDTVNNGFSLNYDFPHINSTSAHVIGRGNEGGGPQHTDAYLAEYNFVDASQLGPEYFGETDLETGAWIPKKYRGSFGTTGFYLDFADNSGVTATTLGKDNSGNGNNWTPNNFSVTAGAGNDSLEDTPTNNWCTLNSAADGTGTRTLSNGNLQADLSGAGAKGVGTFLIPTSGKWYWEMTANDSNSNQAPGVLQHDSDFGTYDTSKAASYFPNGEYRIESASQTSGFSSYTTNDVIGFAVDADTSPPEIFFAKNNTWQNSADPAAGTNGFDLSADKRYLPYMQHGSSSSSSSGIFNFGQRAFAYTPPAGFQALNARNLPTPTIHDGTKYFNTVLFTGNGSTQSITGVGFQPDWTWIKMRSDGSRGHALFDSVRGGTERLDSSATQEGRTNEGNISFQADGFNVTSSHPTVNDSSDTAVAWNWKANGSGSANTDGSISSTVSVNAEAGFSIVSFTAPSGSNQGTVGHGLNVKPKVIIAKNRDTNANNWAVFHEEATDTTSKFLRLNTTDSVVTYSTVWGSALPTSTVFGVTGGGIAASGTANIAYCFAEVEGYSKFGSYTGNGSDNGPYITTNFRPAFVLVKSATNGNGWYLADTTRSPFNVSQATLSPHADDSEDTTAGGAIDILSNGFKSRNSAGQFNDSGQTYVYLAFAETSFKYANAR